MVARATGQGSLFAAPPAVETFPVVIPVSVECRRSARESLRPSVVSDQQIRVLEALAAHDHCGLTDEQIQQVAKLSPSSERPRRGELVEMGLVEESGRRRPTPSGRAATVWRVTDAGRRMLEPGGAL